MFIINVLHMILSSQKNYNVYHKFLTHDIILPKYTMFIKILTHDITFPKIYNFYHKF